MTHRRFAFRRALALLVCLLACSFGQAAPPVTAKDAPARTAVIGPKTLWRVRLVYETEEILTPSGDVVHGHITMKDKDWYAKHPTAVAMAAENYDVKPSASFVRIPRDTSPDWMKPEFDDSDWARQGLSISYTGSGSRQWKAIFARTRFGVDDPAVVSDLKLNLVFAGGVAVYLNGREIAREFLPAHEGNLFAPAEPYPDAAYFDAQGYAFNRKDKSNKAGMDKRLRRINELAIPAGALRKGVNTLAIAAVRSPSPAKWLTARMKKRGSLDKDCYWGHLRLSHISLTAATDKGLQANVAPFKGYGFHIWNLSIAERPSISAYPEYRAPLHPVRLAGCRNGLFAGAIGVTDEKPIDSLTVKTAPLKQKSGKAAIPASAVEVRPVLGDLLEDAIPGRYGVHKDHGSAFAPLWIRVRVPADALPGDYAGKIIVAADNVPAREVPLQLSVADWTLPPIRDYHAMMDYIQSPESVAMAYDVPLWSDAHFKLLDRTFAVLSEIGCKTLFITAVRRTHFGNEHAMLRWILDEDFNIQPDFTIVEKYLDTALKRLERIPAVVFCCWEPAESAGHADLGGQRIADKKIMLTVVDPDTGELSPQTGPAWGTPEAKEFWRKANQGMLAVLKKRGMEKSLLFGLIGDARPSKGAMDDITTGIENARWAAHSHFRVRKWQGYDVQLGSALWGIGIHTVNPSHGLGFGWANDWWLTLCARGLSQRVSPVLCRTTTERWIGGWQNQNPYLFFEGVSGVSRVGADFWRVVKDRHGNPRATLAGRYPESCWGQLNLNNFMTAILGQGKNGAIPTIRSESFRENIQEIEARIYIEKAWLDPAADKILGEEMLGRIRNLLNDRIRLCLNPGHAWFASSGWAERNREMFELAEQVKKKYGGKEPNPNLKSRNKR